MALQLQAMDQEECLPSVQMYRGLLQACMRRKDLGGARRVHAHLAARGLESDELLGNLAVTTLVNCGSLADGLYVFQRLSVRTVFSWTAIISGYGNAGQCREALWWYGEMLREGVLPDKYTFVSLLKACSKVGDLEGGKQIHADALRLGLESDVFVGSTLVSMYAKCGSIEHARDVFDRLSHRNVVSWTTMVAAYAEQGLGEMALRVYQRMQEEGIRPDGWTIVSALQACGKLAEEEESAVVHGLSVKVEALVKGKEIHAEAVARGFALNGFLLSALVCVYGKCGSIRDARCVFDMSSHQDVVSWTAMITAYAQQGQAEMALQVYAQMKAAGVRPDSWTLVSALQACGIIAEQQAAGEQDIPGPSDLLHLGKAINAEAAKWGLESHLLVANSLVSVYTRCGSLKDAQQVFDKLCHRDVVAWNKMIAAYSQHGQGEKALQLYAKMQAGSVTSDEATFLSVLEACGNTGALAACLHIYLSIRDQGLDSSPAIATSLIHALGKCGSMEDAQTVFDALPQPDVVSWTALIAGYAHHGACNKAIHCYQNMCQAGVKPDRVTFTALLSACSHAGMVEQGLGYFSSMAADYGIPPELEHYICIIDLVARAGLFSKAQHLLTHMPMQPTLPVWLSLLAACRKHGNVGLAELFFQCAAALDPEGGAAFVLMWNIYADAGLWEQANQINQSRQQAGAMRKPGQSWIEHKQEVHTFLVGGHQQQHLVLHGLLKELNSALKEKGLISQLETTSDSRSC